MHEVGVLREEKDAVRGGEVAVGGSEEPERGYEDAGTDGCP